MTKPSAEGLVVPTGEISLAGKVVLVTGASTGIGRATAQACAEAGADLAITYLSDEAGAAGSAERIRALGRRVEVFRVDLADAAAVTALAAHARAALGRVDVWINNAGADVLTEAAHLSWTEKLDQLLSVDLRGTVLASWAAQKAGGSAERRAPCYGRLGPRGRGWNDRSVRAGVLRREGRRLQLQPCVGAHGGAAHPGQRDRSRLGRNRVRGDARSRRQTAHHDGDSPAALGAPGGGRGGSRVPGQRQGRLHHRTDVDDQRAGT